MGKKKAAITLIVISIIFALLMILASYLLAGTGYTQTVVMLLVAIWFIPFAYLTRARNRNSD